MDDNEYTPVTTDAPVIVLDPVITPELELADWAFLLSNYGTVLALLAVITILAAVFAVYSKANFGLKLLVIPLLFSMYYAILYKADDVLGYAYPTLPAGQVLYLGGERTGEIMELWVRHIGDKYTRLYRIPYSKKNQEMFEKVKKGTESGIQYLLSWPADNIGSPANVDDLVVTDMIDLYSLEKNYEQDE